jgi:hypothetical protein
MEDRRCKRNAGPNKWRCGETASPGKSYCEKHLFQQRKQRQKKCQNHRDGDGDGDEGSDTSERRGGASGSNKNKKKKKKKVSLMCHQCQRSNKNGVVVCSNCHRKRYCYDCLKKW